ncbi:MAG: hypothetical protein NC320_06430, partial [Clostridium sp.]|nr:hypothetical protein [Clostridium sp.]MCM1547645.1 hypothetical protein [Ruminococcus sp.]
QNYIKDTPFTTACKRRRMVPPTGLEPSTSSLEEYYLAYVYVNKGVTSISQSAVTDTRLDNALYGFVMRLIKQLNMSELFAQYQPHLKNGSIQ